MVKKIITLLSIMICICFLTSCGNVEIHPISLQKLKDSQINKCKITKVCDISELSYDEKEATISAQTMEELVEDELDEYEHLEKLNRKIVEKGDYITFSYHSTCEGKVIAEARSYPVKVGSGNFDINAENAMIGKEKGKKFTINLVISQEGGELAGKEEQMEITVADIYKRKAVVLTDKWVQENYGLDNVEAFYNDIKEKYLEEEQGALEYSAKDALLQNAVDACDYKINQKEVLEYALLLYNERAMAAISYGANMEDYVSDLYDMNLETYYEQCYQEAENMIKRILLVGALAKQHGITIDQKEADNWMEYERTDDRGMIEYEMLEENVIDFLARQAI